MLRLFRNLLPLLLAVTFAASGALASDSPVLDRVIESKTLRVGMSGNQPPMNTKSRSGQLIGYDVDLARSLALAMGAVAAGFELCSMYPITPATSASHVLAEIFEELGGFVHGFRCGDLPSCSER